MADYSSIFEAAGKAHNVDPALLRAVMYRGEMSNGDPRAVSPKGATGLMQLMPDTAKEMGVTDINDPQQNIFGGAKYLSQQLDKYGSVPLALAAYNAGPGAVDRAGGIPNFPETQAYVKRIMSAYQGQNMPKSNQLPGLPPDAATTAGDDPFSKFMATAGGAQKGVEQTSASADDPFSRFMTQGYATTLTAPDQIERKMAAGSAPKSKASANAQPYDMMPHDLLGATVEPLLTAGTSMIAQPVGGVARALAALGGYGYEGAEKVGNKITDVLTYHPQTAGGQESLAGLKGMAAAAGRAVMDTPVGNALSSISKAYNDTFVKGTSNPLLATINDQVPTIIANAAIPAVAKAAGSTINKGVNAINTLRGATSAAPVIEAGSVPFQTAADRAASIAAKAEAAAAKPKYIPNGDGTFTQIKPATIQGAPVFEAPELPKPKAKLPLSEQQANIQTMREIGLDTQRQSAITGDKFTAGQEFQHSKLNSPMGDVVREQLQKEQAAIKNYANSIVKDTGATAATPEAIGQSVRAPLQALSEHYDNQIRGLYQAANERAGGIAGIEPEGFGKIMGTDSMFAGKAENSTLRRGIRAYMREQGIVDAQGNIQPITAQQAEGMRQYLNSQWSPQNSGLIGKIKESLDMDVAKAGGDDIYAQARALHAERKNTLDNPKGIASLLEESGPNGINQRVPDEKIGSRIVGMPTGQFEHVVNTLKNMPAELQPQAQQALSEIKGEIAKQIYKAGDSGGTQNGPSMWNAANVTRELNKQSSKMALVFSPDEIAKFQTLNRGGHLLQTPSAYPGAAVQGHNLLQRGMIWAPAAGGAALGHSIAGYPGMAVGSAVGSSLAGKMAARADLQNANKLRAIMANPQPVK